MLPDFLKVNNEHLHGAKNQNTFEEKLVGSKNKSLHTSSN
jgi:hypothetical protein